MWQRPPAFTSADKREETAVDAKAIYEARLAALGYVPLTLCELCGNACGRCRWSRKDVQKPVEGWEAVRRDVYMTEEEGGHMTESYVVLSCPEFDLEVQHWFWYLNFDRHLARALAESEEDYGENG